MRGRGLRALGLLLAWLIFAPAWAALAQEPGAPSGNPPGVCPPPAAAAPEGSAPARPRIALMAIEVPREVAPAAMHCPICGVGLDVGEIAPGGAERLTDLVFAWLPANRCYDVIPPGVSDGAYQRLLRESMTRSTLDYMRGVGAALGAEAVLGGVLYRYRERVGTAYSVSRAASVGFDLHLIRTSDGLVIWSGHFDETQKDLSQNIFNIMQFFKRGVRWLTVDEFAAKAVPETFKSFPRQLPPPK